ncbi:MAG: pyruvate carboxylase subunit B [Synergistaceae bacterium]|nr:pyruvate carboxylase subunit B [Synergistaceae bacterium]
MAKANKKKALIMETVLRDGHQSLMATRMRTSDMIDILEKMDDIGYYALEMWGGATFDAAMRFLDEDPWERLRIIRKHVKNAKLQMLLRGQNLVGYRHYADDTVREFVKRMIGNGIDIVRVFDALNDLRNMEIAADQVKKEKGHLQMCISYTLSPVHTLDSFVQMAVEMKGMGADSIAIKDMAGLLNPADAIYLIKSIKEKTGGIMMDIHSHYTSGMASMTYFAAIEAGADIVDCAISPFSCGTSQPPTESLVAALHGTPYDTGLSLEKLAQIAFYFKDIREKYKNIIVDIGVDVNVLLYQIPGGMYSNLVSQLKEANSLDKLPEVLAEIPIVRKAMGYPPLVTPTSQIVGTQAVMNVVTGRWKMFSKEVKQYFLGYYGRPPAEVDPEVRKLAIGSDEPITCRPGEKIPPEMEQARKNASVWATQEEDALSWIMFPQVAKDFLPKKFAMQTKRDVGLNELVDESAYPA